MTRESIEARIVGFLALACYVTLGSVLVFGHHVVIGDALARVANANAAVFSRDPHLAAVGFVWSPLPTMVLLPLLLLRGLWPSLATQGFAANLVSAAFMAASVVQLRGLLADAGVRRGLRLGVSFAFAAHPIIAYYGANGMSEATLIFFCLWAARRLATWLRTDDLRSLAWAGIALAFAYLSRYEAAAGAVGAALLVGVVAYRRGGVDRASRRAAAFANAVVIGLPSVAAVVAWAAASWAIVGHPFEQFSSIYGNANQVRLAGEGVRRVAGTGAGSPLNHFFSQLAALEPAALVVVALGLVVAIRRRDVAVLAPACVLGPVVAFQAAAVSRGETFAFLRYGIALVPLVCLLAGVVGSGPRRSRFAPGALPRFAAGVGVLAMLGVALPSAARALGDRRLAPEEAHFLSAVVASNFSARDQALAGHTFDVEQRVARDLDSIEIRGGAVLVDSAFGFPVVTASRHPRRFVITSDRDFPKALEDPVLNHIRYLLTTSPSGTGAIDALNRRYPTLYERGTHFARRVYEWKGARGTTSWRLYEVKRV
jgi:hypothetical protein